MRKGSKHEDGFPPVCVNLLHGFCSGFRALLILDDIWDSSVLKAFDVQCRILLTTRNRSLTNSVSGMCPSPSSGHCTLE